MAVGRPASHEIWVLREKIGQLPAPTKRDRIDGYRKERIALAPDR